MPTTSTKLVCRAKRFLAQFFSIEQLIAVIDISDVFFTERQINRLYSSQQSDIASPYKRTYPKEREEKEEGRAAVAAAAGEEEDR